MTNRFNFRCGMVADEIYNVIAYGWSNKSDKPNMIGMYGNGLKSGSMRVANDCLVLSKKNNECSALMISQTFIKTPSSKFENPDVSFSRSRNKSVASKLNDD